MDTDNNQQPNQQSQQGDQSGDMVNPVQIQKALGGMDYPASKQDLINYAGRKGGEADKNVMDTLQQLPDQQYDTPADVSQAIGDME